MIYNVLISRCECGVCVCVVSVCVYVVWCVVWCVYSAVYVALSVSAVRRYTHMVWRHLN